MTMSTLSDIEGASSMKVVYLRANQSAAEATLPSQPSTPIVLYQAITRKTPDKVFCEPRMLRKAA